ncbi:hypothetical protein SEA_JOURNEY13_72 [Mycobacterium phage Journey13]|nr:hypothetical protein SEA_JOURNEY13_72 [Mycobacterium phage Journey13]
MSAETPAPIRVFVYKNLHQTRKNGKPWYSVQALDGDFKGRVIRRSGYVLLANVKGVVRKGGRERALREGKKNVHAGLVGELISVLPQDFVGSKITYNPYLRGEFFHVDTGEAFKGADRVYLSEDGVCAA